MGNLSCKIDDGEGERNIWSFDWGCKVKSCDPGYGEEDNECILLSGPCTLNPGVTNAKTYKYDTEGICVIDTCNSGYTLSNGKCVGDGSETETDGETGTGGYIPPPPGAVTQYIKGVGCTTTAYFPHAASFQGNSTGDKCEPVTCVAGYKLESGQCVPNFEPLKTCNPGSAVPNAATYKANSDGTSCLVDTCSSGFTLNTTSGQCDPTPGTACTPTTRVTNSASYTIVNGSCQLTSCDVGYNVTGSTCTSMWTPGVSCTPIPLVPDAATYKANSTGTRCELDTCGVGYEPSTDKTACNPRYTVGQTSCTPRLPELSVSFATEYRTNWQGTTCTPSTCAAGYTLASTQCVPIPVDSACVASFKLKINTILLDYGNFKELETNGPYIMDKAQRLAALNATNPNRTMLFNTYTVSDIACGYTATLLPSNNGTPQPTHGIGSPLYIDIRDTIRNKAWRLGPWYAFTALTLPNIKSDVVAWSP